MENAKLERDWVQRLGRVDTPDNIKPATKFDHQFVIVFEPRNLPTRTLGNTLERLRSFQDTYGPNVFADVPSQIKSTPDNIMRDSFIAEGLTMTSQDRKLEQTIDRALSGL